LIDVFSSDDRGFVGYLGARGVISPTVALAVPFAMSQLSGNGGYFGQDSALLSFPDAIYRLDISTQRLTLLAVPPANQRFVSVSSMWETKTSGEELANFCIVAALPKAIEAFDQNGAALVYAPIPDPTTKFYAATVWYWRHPARFNALFMAQPTGSAQPDYVHHPYRFITVNAAGVVTSEIATHPVEFNVGKQPSIASAMAMLVIVPIGAIVGATVIGVYAAMGQPHALADAYHYIIHFQYLDLAVIWTLVGAVIFALVMLAFSRVYAWNRRDTIKWMIGGALLSWPGILMLLAVVPFPLRIACSSCGRKRLASRMTCEHCGAAAMQPARDGTEIFEGAAKAPAIAE
jgi:hypothetical protein